MDEKKLPQNSSFKTEAENDHGIILESKDTIRRVTIASLTNLSCCQSKNETIAQNFVLVWLDADIDENHENFQNSLTQLRRNFTEVQNFTNVEECLDYLNSIENEKILLILSGELAKRIVPSIHDMPQLDSIIIFRLEGSSDQAWTKNWVKVQGFFTSIDLACESLKKVAHDCEHNAISMSLLSREVIEQVSTNEKVLDRLEPSYMYSLLFKEIILEIDEDETQALNDFIDYCRKNGIAESQLKTLTYEYQDKSPIYWYTCEIFLYHMLNRSLALLEIEKLTRMGFFIRSLHRRIEKLHKQESYDYSKPLIFYRGQGLSKEKFDRILDAKGGLLSFSNFLSTSQTRDVAMKFIERQLEKHKEYIRVIYIITVHLDKLSKSCAPFTSIESESAIPNEKEILFSMSTVFRVCKIEGVNSNDRLYWEVHLTLTNDNDPKLAILTQYIREELNGSTPWQRLGDLVLKMGNYSFAEELYQKLLNNASNDSDRAHIYHQLGLSKAEQGKYSEATLFYEESLKIQQTMLPENYPSLAKSYGNIGYVHHKKGEFCNALEFYEKARRIKESAVLLNRHDLATSYNNIGSVFLDMGNYSKAIEFYEKTHEIYLKTLPSNHPSLATSYYNISTAYDKIGNESKALELSEKADRIFENVLPPNHADLATLYNKKGKVYLKKGDLSKALELYEKAFQIRKKALCEDHPDLADCYDNIGKVYYNIQDYEKAFQYYENACQLREKVLYPNHPDLGDSYINFGDTYDNKCQYQMALEYYQKGQLIYEHAIPQNNWKLANVYNKIGVTYNGMNEYTKAVESYKKAIDIEEIILSSNDLDLAESYRKIGVCYNDDGKYMEALEFYKKAFDIKQEVLGPLHCDLITSYSEIGEAYKDIGDYSEALEFYKKALETKERTLSISQLEFAYYYNRIGLVYNSLGDYWKALEFCEKSIGHKRKKSFCYACRCGGFLQ